MKSYKVLTFIVTLCIAFTINNAKTFSYLINYSHTETVSLSLGNIKLEVDNTPQNAWRYVPIHVLNNSNDNNDLVDIQTISSDLNLSCIRPGDGFEKDITLTNIGSLNTKLKIAKGNELINSPFCLSIKAKSYDADVKVTQDANDWNVWHIDNLKSNSKAIFTIRLEVPIQISNNDLNEGNITLFNNSLDLLNITTTQWNNETIGE